MGIIKAFTGAISGTFADQWKDIITADEFDEHVIVSPGIQKTINRGRGTNQFGSDGILSNGSKVFVPENTAAFIFSQSGVEEIITEVGGYTYQYGQSSVFNGDGIKKSIFKQTKDRIGYGGISEEEKRICFVNLREIRDIKFGTRGPQVYNDLFYGTDLEIKAFGTFTIKVTDPKTLIQNYIPANAMQYSFDEPKARSQIVSEFLQSFIVAVNSLSNTYRISQLPGQANTIADVIANDTQNVGTWPIRFGFSLVAIAIENVEFTDDSRELVKLYSANKMNLKAYDDVSQRTSDIAAQQRIAEGIRDHGLGNAAGMVFGMNVAQGLNGNARAAKEMSFDEQIETLKKLKGLVDAGILTEEEFNTKKKEIMGL